MKKIVLKLVLFCILSVTALSSYNFPLDNPYSATIIGSSTMMTPGVSEEIPTKVYSVKIKDNVPDIFWYASEFKFSFTKKDKNAPLIFILAGTGSDYSSSRVHMMEKIFYDAGYNVISISSPMSLQFLVSASTESMPGLLMKDGEDIYKAMKVAYNEIKNQIDSKDFYIMGYSLGGANSAIVSYIDEQEKVFNFKRVFMVNPPVNLFESATRLDKYLDNFTGGNPKVIQMLIEGTLGKVKQGINEYSTMNSATIYDIVKGDFLSDEYKKAFIGLAFRINSVDLNFTSDVLNKMEVYTENPDSLNKFTNMKEAFAKVNFANFEDYVNKLGYPYYKKINPNFNLEDLKREASLRVIEDYLKNSKKIAAVTNADELILSQDDFEYLKEVFKDRLVIYPKGGHCGNMFYKENVDVMLNFINEGVLKYEN